MKKRFSGLFLIAMLCGCATTPPSVIRGQEMAIEAVSKVEGDSYQIIDAYNVEVKALVANRYAAEFAATEAQLLAEQGNTGSVDLARYKDYSTQFAAEIEKANAFYDNLALQAKSQLGFKFGVAKNMSLAVRAYNKAAGVDPETFQQLLDASGGLASDVIDAYGAANVAKPTDPSKPDWKRILDLMNKNKIETLPKLGDANAAWQKWVSTGKLPTLTDLFNNVLPKARDAAGTASSGLPTTPLETK